MMHSNQLKAVLFDIDDTLFDRKTAVKKALRLMMRTMPQLFSGIPEYRVFSAFRAADEIARDDFESGKPGAVVRDKRSRAFLRGLGLPELHSKKVTELYIDAFPGVSTEVKGAHAVVERIAEAYQLGIISNAYPDVQYNKLRGIGILDYFDTVVLSEECGIRKPDEKIFQRAAAALGCDAKECIYVGDSFENDIIGAARAGMKTCWFNADGKQMQAQDLSPDFVIAELPELLDILGA
jgi:putative hydrolase of the HAD superfamily